MTLNVSLTPELVALIGEKVASDDFESASEVVRAGLRLLQQQQAPSHELKLQGALRESEERLRNLSDHLPDGMVYQVAAEQNGTRRFLFVSAGVERLFGIAAEDALRDASTLYGLILDDCKPLLAEGEDAALRSRSLFNMEVQVRRTDGQIRWVRISSAPRALPEGPTIWDGVVLDITDRRQAEAQVKESEQRLAIATQAADLGIWDWNVATDAMVYSERAKAIHGFPPGSQFDFAGQGGRQAMSRRRLSTSAESFGTSR